MKIFLLFFLMIFSPFFYGQIEFGPNVNHNMESYAASIVGNGTIYYTTDGTDPTINSPFGINQVDVMISQNIVLKAKLKKANGEWSQVFSRPYYIGVLPQKTVYFKPPPSWTNICSYMNFIQPEFMVDFWGPGSKMIPACEGWFKDTYGFYEASVWFNNCSIAPPPYYESFYITTEDTVFYDYSQGPITNPPSCLLGVNDPSKRAAIVKVFPNPVQDFVTIDYDKKISSFEIVDATGKSVLQNIFKTNKINVSALTSGLYFIKLKTLTQDTVMVKFIKK